MANETEFGYEGWNIENINQQRATDTDPFLLSLNQF